MSLNPAINIIKKYEGLQLRVYTCPGGKETIGWGHVVKPNESFRYITDAQAEMLLMKDIRDAEEAMLRFIKVPLNNNQKCALISFIFNLGSGNFQSSTLLKVINEERHLDVPEQLIRWVFVSGKKFRGLMRRRCEESLLYVS